jgi:hypothetical protein
MSTILCLFTEDFCLDFFKSQESVESPTVPAGEMSSGARALPAPEQIRSHSRLADRIYRDKGDGVLDAMQEARLNGGEPPRSTAILQ